MPKVLIAPLDWGLGHATRILPLVNLLQKFGFEVIIASEGVQQKLIQIEFPLLQQISFKGYRITYANNKRWFPYKILLQTPKILLRIKKEHIELQKIIHDFKIDLVISDNRYGLWTKLVPCIFITHQLNIKVPFLWMEKLLQQINYSYINHYTQCWIPDFEKSPNLAGSLSHPLFFPKTTVKYIGALTRLKSIDKLEKKYKWLILLSGPEPQRTALENKFLEIFSKMEGDILMIRGKPGNDETLTSTKYCTIINHLSTSRMQQAFAKSEFIISRSGYTTVMEILSLKKKSILIPTPGQTEQEYLAEHLMKQQWSYCFKQDEKNLLSQINKAANFNYQLPDFDSGYLENTVVDFIKQYLQQAVNSMEN